MFSLGSIWFPSPLFQTNKHFWILNWFREVNYVLNFKTVNPSARFKISYNIIGWKKVCIFTSKILSLNPQTVRELHLNLNSIKGSHIPAGVSVFFRCCEQSVSFHGAVRFTRAATGYWHRVTLPRWKFEEDPRHKKFVVSLVTALKTVIAALQTDRSSWPFSATLIVMRKTVSLVARNKFVNRDTATNGDGICWKRFEYAACGRENFRIRKKIFAEKKISGYVWTWP